MNSGIEILISPETLLRFFVAMLYVPAGLLAYRRVFPRLSPPAKRLAGITLGVQLLVIMVAIGQLSESGFTFWLWHLDLEWNIPSILSSSQLAMVGGIAFATAWHSRRGPVAHLLYLVALAVFFIVLGLEEFFSWKDSMSETDWRSNYAILGAAVFIATTLIASRAPRSERAWLILLLIGLSLLAVGGGLIDSLPAACGVIGILRIDGCFYFYRSPEEIVEILGGWVALLAILSQFSRATRHSPARVWRLVYLIPVVWILLLILYSPVNSLEVQPPAQPASVQFESNAQLHGFQTDERGLPAIAYVYLPYDVDITQLGFSIHLVDQLSGESVASREIYAHRRYDVWPGGRGYEPVYAQTIDVPVSPKTSVNRALWVVLSHWRTIGDQFVQQAVLASNLRLLNDTQVVLDELVLPAESPESTGRPIALFENGFALADVAAPTAVQVGDTLEIRFTWRADADSSEDYAQFLHFVPEESGAQWGFDQQPLGPRLPTRLWYSGLIDSENWEVPLPGDLEPGLYAIFTGLYRLSDLERLPAMDAEERLFDDARVPLGQLTVTG